MKKWREKEVEFLKKNYLRLTYNELAYELNRNKKSVEGKLKDLGLKKSRLIPISKILKSYYKIHSHHTKGKPKSEEQKRKMSTARKKYLKRTDSQILRKTYDKMARTKRISGLQLGEKNPMYGKKRPDLAKRNKEQWKKLSYRKQMQEILVNTTYKGSKRQKNLYEYLVKTIGKEKIKYNDWVSLNYKYEIDISIPSLKIAIEWDGYRWHYENNQNEKRDLRKNKAILDKGWKFIRIIDDHLNKSELKKTYNNVIHIIDNLNTPMFKHTGGFYIE
tara:strand:+ start:1417 stop:2241 length:825 start_codon:yes stop_codon:yes gene_type:complete